MEERMVACCMVFCCRSMTPRPDLSLALFLTLSLAVGPRRCNFQSKIHFTLQDSTSAHLSDRVFDHTQTA